MTRDEQVGIWVTLIVLVVFGFVMFAAYSVYTAPNRRKDPVNQRSIVMAMINYAKDHEGRFPAANEAGEPFADSTEAFQYILKEGELKEEYFYVPGNPKKRRGADNNGYFTQGENCLVYITGQNEDMSSTSPLTADEMESPGLYGRNHPWLKDGYAVVGYVGGHAKASKLSQKTPGATVLGPAGSGITDIFQLRTRPVAPGLMEVSREHILLP